MSKNLEQNYQSELQQYVKTAESLNDFAISLKIETKEEVNCASENLAKIKNLAKKLEERRKEITKPIDDAKKSVMALFKKPTELLENAEKMLKKSILNFQLEQQKILDEERKRTEAERVAEEKILEENQKKLQENLTSKNLNKIRELVEEKKEIQKDREEEIKFIKEETKVEGISFREIWKFEVIDENLIPREYLIPDEKKLQAIATATKGILTISGVKFFSEKVLASRRF